MKKALIVLLFGMLLCFSFVLAEGNETDNNETDIDDLDLNETDDEDNETDDDRNGTRYGLGGTIRNRVKAGVYTSPTGEQIRVRELAQNKNLLMVGNVSAECNTCNITGEYDPVQNRTKLKVKLSNGRNAEIKTMPDRASETALARLRLKVCNETNNCTLELKERKKGNESQLRYEIQVERHYKILGMFRAKAQEKIEVNAETGEIESQRRAWWRFLAVAQDD